MNVIPNRLLDVLADPPVVDCFVVTDGNETGSSSDRKLVFLRGPFDSDRASLNSNENHYLFPYSL